MIHGRPIHVRKAKPIAEMKRIRLKDDYDESQQKRVFIGGVPLEVRSIKTLVAKEIGRKEYKWSEQENVSFGSLQLNDDDCDDFDCYGGLRGL